MPDAHEPLLIATVAVGLAQGLGLMPEEGVQLIVSAAIVSITLNPFLFAAIEPVAKRLAEDLRLRALSSRPEARATSEGRGEPER